jgi:ANTAR domain-containing protein
MIEHAKGVLAERLDIDIDAALDELVRHSERVGRPLGDVARAVLDGDPATTRPDAETPSALVVLVRRFDPTTLDALRDLVSRRLRTAGLPEAVRNRLLFVVHQAAADAVRDGGGSGRLWLWSHAGTLWCEVSDDGRSAPPDITVPAAAPDRLDRHDGAWLIDQAVDDLLVLAEPTAGVRLLLRYRPPMPGRRERG